MSLAGRRVLILRPSGQDAALRASLEARGAIVRSVPAVRITPADPAPIDDALARADTFDWAVFTSVNGVRAVAARARIGGRPPAFGRIAAIGPATADALREAGWPVDWMPVAYTTRAIADGLPGSGSAVLFRADIATPALDDTLRARGFTVHRVDAYRSQTGDAEAIRAAAADAIDVVVLTSASIARTFGSARVDPPLVCSIGPATTEAARAAGVRVDVEARDHTTGGVVKALEDAFGDDS